MMAWLSLRTKPSSSAAQSPRDGLQHAARAASEPSFKGPCVGHLRNMKIMEVQTKAARSSDILLRHPVQKRRGTIMRT